MPPPLLLPPPDSLALSFSKFLLPILPLEPSFRRLARAAAGESLRGGLGGAPLLKDRWGSWWKFRVARRAMLLGNNNIVVRLRLVNQGDELIQREWLI